MLQRLLEGLVAKVMKEHS